MISAFGRFIRKIVSPRIYRIIRLGPMLVPKYYRTNIAEVEKIIDIQRCYLDIEDEEMATLILRKQAHIIDKGLQRKDFMPGRGNEPYQCALKEYRKIKTTDGLRDPSVVWSREKIHDYERKQKEPEARLPYETSSVCELPTSETLRNLIVTRRSVRHFKEQQVATKILRECIDVINWAPSSCNKQPIHVFLTNDPERAAECAKTCKGATGFGPFVPSFMAICADTRGYIYPSEMYLPSVDSSLGTQNMLLMLHAKGLSSTVLSWAQKDEEEEMRLRKLLNIPEHFIIIINVVAGYADTVPPTPIRKSVNLTMHINECDR